MKIKFFIFVFICLVGFGIVFTACSEDNSTPIVPSSGDSFFPEIPQGVAL